MPTIDAPPSAPALAAQVRAVSFSYAEREALREVTIDVPQGAVLGLLGPNGSGKSTLLSLLAGLRRPDAGEMTILGRRPGSEVRSRIGFLFQETSLDPLMPARETLHLHGRLYGMRGPALKARTEDLLDSFGLAARARDPVRTLSGGMKRRLELARALLPSPELLLLDEPTTGLDPDSEQALWSHLSEINRDGVTIVLATNNVLEADRYCRSVAFVALGRVVAQGTPAGLKSGLRRDGVWVEGDFTDGVIATVRSWPDVGALTWAPPVLHATVDAASAFVPRLFQAAGDTVRSVRLREATLEDAYFDLVGSRLEEEGR